MGRYSLKDGKVTANKLAVSGKLPVQYVIPKTVAYSTAALLSNENINANGTTAYAKKDILIQPAYAMPLLVTANAAGTAANTDALTIVGVDGKGDVISESVIVSSTAGTSTQSNNAFASITSITPNAVSACTSLGLGYNNAELGLPYPIAVNTDIINYAYDGGYSTTAASGLTIDADYDTVTILGTAAAKVVQVTYKTVLQE